MLTWKLLITYLILHLLCLLEECLHPAEIPSFLIHLSNCDYFTIASGLVYAAELHPEFEELEKVRNHDWRYSG